MVGIESRISELAKRGVLDIESVGGESALIADGALLQRSPLFPLVARMVCASWNRLQRQDETAAIITEGFRYNDSPLAFSDAIDAAFEAPAFLEKQSLRLRDSLLERARVRSDDRTADLAARALDGLVRLSVGNWTPKHAVLDVLSRVTGEERDIFAGRACRLAGICFEMWREQDLLAVLDRLSAAAPGDAAYERGMAALVLAFERGTMSEIVEGLRDARKQLARAEAFEEERTDAAAFGAAIDAILAFTSGAGSLVVKGFVERLAKILQGRHAWLSGTSRTWLTPRIQAEIEWLRLATLLQDSAAALERKGWLDGAVTLSQVLQAYCASRSVRMFVWAGNGHLDLILEPRIENAFIESEAARAVLNEWLEGRVPEQWKPHAERLRKALFQRKKAVGPVDPGPTSKN